MESKLTYPVILHNEDVGYSVEIPDIGNGIWTQGDSVEESLKMAVDAIGSMLIDENSYPKATLLKNIKLENDNDIKSIVSIDMDNYRKKKEKIVKDKNSIRKGMYIKPKFKNDWFDDLVIKESSNDLMTINNFLKNNQEPKVYKFLEKNREKNENGYLNYINTLYDQINDIEERIDKITSFQASLIPVTVTIGVSFAASKTVDIIQSLYNTSKSAIACIIILLIFLFVGWIYVHSNMKASKEYSKNLFKIKRILNNEKLKETTK